MRGVRLNADVGEGAGADADLMPLVDAANVGCGAHAGDPVVTRAALELARDHGVEIGAHPGYPDRDHAGRRELGWPPEQIGPHLLSQVGGLLMLARALPAVVTYLKPHGALYHRANSDPAIARTVAAVALLTGLELVGLPDSELEAAARRLNRPYRREGFADRRYLSDGTLVPRTAPDALITDPAEAAEQVRRLVRDYGVETVCVHGDTPGAAEFTRALRQALEMNGGRA